MRIDLHNHSEFSFDSRNRLEDMKNLAKAEDIAYMAITDHDIINDAVIKDDFFIAGCEFTTDKGHLIGLFLKKHIETRHVDELIQEIKKQDGLVVIPHPLRKGSGFSEKDIIKYAKEIDAIEVFNPDNTFYGNLVAYNLAKKLGKCMVTGSDSHTPDAVGAGASLVQGEIKDKHYLKQLIRHNKLKITLDQKYNPENYRSLNYSLVLYAEMLMRKSGLYNMTIVKRMTKPIYKFIKVNFLKKTYR